MEIATNEYRLTPDLFFRVGTRVSYRKIWFVPVIALALAVALVILGDTTMKIIGVFEGLVLALLPMIKVKISASRIKLIPLYQLPYVMTFVDDAMTQSSSGEARSVVRYEEIVRVHNDREALVVFFTRSLYVLVPKSAFKSAEDVDAVLAMFRSKGLSK